MFELNRLYNMDCMEGMKYIPDKYYEGSGKMQESIYGTKDVRKVKTCSCGAVKDKATILNNFAHIGINTQFQDNGVFKDNKACYVENNFCPQCGKKYEVR